MVKSQGGRPQRDVPTESRYPKCHRWTALASVAVPVAERTETGQRIDFKAKRKKRNRGGEWKGETPGSCSIKEEVPGA